MTHMFFNFLILKMPEGGVFIVETVAPVWSWIMPGWKPPLLTSDIGIYTAGFQSTGSTAVQVCQFPPALPVPGNVWAGEH